MAEIEFVPFEELMTAVDRLHADHRDRQAAISRRELPDYGYGPMTEATRHGHQNAEAREWRPTEGENAAYRLRATRGQAGENAAPIVQAMIDRGSPEGRVGMGHLAAGMATQPMETATAWENALVDPSIANVTDAGMQTALLAGRPMGAIKTLGAGYGAAVAKDAGLVPSGIDPAYAGRKGRQPEAPPVARLPGLTDEDQATYSGIMSRLAGGDFGSSAERRALEAQAKVFQDKAGAAGQEAIRLEAAKKAADQAEYDRSVRNAEAARDAELARNRRFSDTEVGKLWDKTGGLAPGALAFGTGMLTRAATGGRAGYLVPTAVGAAEGAVASNVPLAYNALFTEPDNPERRAYEAYARELPANHPRKTEWSAYAQNLPQANPIRATASAELYDPAKAAERAVYGALEGTVGGLAGAKAAALPGRLVEGAAAMPGRVRAAYQGANVAGDAAEAQAIEAAEKLRQSRLSAVNVQQQTAEADALAQSVSPPAASASPPMAAPAAQPIPQAAPQPQLPPPLPAQNPSGNPLIAPTSNVADLSRIGYGAAQKNVVRPLITSEVAAGRPVPTMEAVSNALIDSGLPSPTIGAFPNKLETARAQVEAMRARGIPDSAIAATIGDLMKRGKGGLPVVAAGVGAGAMAASPDAEAEPHWTSQKRGRDGRWK